MDQHRTEMIVNIRPEVSVYATYRRLSYRPWYAIAEFVDNSTQNYYDHRHELLAAYRDERGPVKLSIEICYDSDRSVLTILDNANGMEMEELARALALDRPPPDRAGRCEYGMGLKTAACWFGTTWTIETSRLGSGRALTATVHIPDLVAKRTENILVQEQKASLSTHFTRITISGLYKPIRGRTAGRIRDQLGSMYRHDLRSGEVEIIWNAQPVSFEDPQFLIDDAGNVWRKDISFQVPWEADEGGTLDVSGWVGIRVPARQRDAGFALLRRGRVILGGPGEGYKPIEVFGQGNTFRSQRLMGELHMDQWPVTQAKDAFDWSGGLEDDLIEQLKRACQDYMDKCEGYRELDRTVTRSDMNLASESTRQILSDSRFGAAGAQELVLPQPPKTQEQETADASRLRSVSEGPVTYRLMVGGDEWVLRLHWQDQITDAHWMSISCPQDTVTDIFLNMAHPFFSPYLNERCFLELIQKMVVAMALAERMAQKISNNELITPSDFRNFMNRVLRYASQLEPENGD